MNYLWDLKQHGNKVAIIDHYSLQALSYKSLQDFVDSVKVKLSQFRNKSLGVILCNNNIGAIVGYLAALQTGHVPMMLPYNLNSLLLEKLLNIYSPEWILSPQSARNISSNYFMHDMFFDCKFFSRLTNKTSNISDIHPDLALVLPTSGSTGNSKMVRLSYGNLNANAHSIMEYLKLDYAEERPVVNLPICYAYGLSIVNSHLLAGATLLTTDKKMTEGDFWKFVNNHSATSISGVPYTYNILKQISFTKNMLPSLRTMTQAGGSLNENLSRHFIGQGYNFFIMYGQTEATARISYVPSSQVSSKLNSIGIAIPGGVLSADNKTQELVYKGNNVMLGYSNFREDLALGDVNKGVLYTGDLGYQDKEGYFYIYGRKNRFIKLFGLRINMDDIEKFLEDKFVYKTACIEYGQKLFIFTENPTKNGLVHEISKIFNLHPTAIKVMNINSIPVSSAHKTDYTKLQELAATV